MTTSAVATQVPPLALPARSEDRPFAEASSGRPLPVATLIRPRVRSTVYGLAAVDVRGRVADRVICGRWAGAPVAGWPSECPMGSYSSRSATVGSVSPAKVTFAYHRPSGTAAVSSPATACYSWPSPARASWRCTRRPPSTRSSVGSPTNWPVWHDHPHHHGGALALRPIDLDPDQCLILLREKGETQRWQPVSPTLMAHLQHHARRRRARDFGGLK